MKCIHGHDLGELGRYKSGHCARCMRTRAARKRQATSDPAPMRSLPIAPLREAIRLRLAEHSEYRRLGATNTNSAAYKLSREFADRFGGDPYTARRQLERMLSLSVTVREEQADRWCSLLGLHLDLLWNPGEHQDRRTLA
jgi:hypothetical protein